MKAPEWWPWVEFDPATRLLPWAATLPTPAGITVRVDHAALTPDALIIMLETCDGSAEGEPPPLRRGSTDFRIFMHVPGDIRLQSVGEWEVEQDEAQVSPDPRGHSLRDYGITDPGTGGGIVVLTPAPPAGTVTLGVSWPKHGVQLAEVMFDMPRNSD